MDALRWCDMRAPYAARNYHDWYGVTSRLAALELRVIYPQPATEYTPS